MTADESWPASTREQVEACVDAYAGELDAADHTMRFNMVVTEKAVIRDVQAQEPRIASRNMEICIRQALERMRVPHSVVRRGLASLNERRVSAQSRAVMGDVTMASTAAAEEVVVKLGPMVVRAGAVGVFVFIGIAVVAAALADDKPSAEECEEEWRRARKTCRELLKIPGRKPARGLTGGHNEVENCARGFVTEACGGNPVEW
ncbi:MAG: hypothetical protein IPM54_25585 [Polyangiaceae bacterium]|nr:hypothetical protein [Polyangiaceae bacterium]